jgi:hypothetical protein
MLPLLVFSCEEKSDYVPEKELPSIEQDVYNNSSIENRSEKEVNYEYRVDLTISAPFASEEVDDSSTGYRHLVEALLDENGGVLIIMHKFSNESLYYAYGESKGLNPRLHDQIANRLAFLADSLNLDRIVDSIGNIPDWWVALEEEVRSELSPLDMTEARSLLTQINDDERYGARCTNGRRRQIVFGGAPVLSLLGWRNRVSGFMPVGIGGVNIVYQRSFYRRRLRTFWSFGLAGIDFCGPLNYCNNSSNSWLRFGL